jgi:hypothetical protein
LHGGVIGTALLWPLRRLRLGEVLCANAQLAAVIAVAAAWDVVREDAGLSSRMWVEHLDVPVAADPLREVGPVWLGGRPGW